MRVGYTRVSTTDQKTDRQDEALAGANVDKLFTDHASGKNTDRPGLAEALRFVRDGDTLVVASMDRLARNIDDLRATVRDLTGRGVRVEFVKESLTFTGEDSPMSNLLLSLLGAVAEFERALILERQREGIALAKAKGVYRGRQVALTAAEADQLRAELAAGGKPAELSRKYGISRSSVYNYRDPDWQAERTVEAGKRRAAKGKG